MVVVGVVGVAGGGGVVVESYRNPLEILQKSYTNPIEILKKS